MLSLGEPGEYTAGCRLVDIEDPASGVTFPALVTYPSVALEQPEMLGPYRLAAARDGAAAAGLFPLVVISHGSGGSGLTHRFLATFLARHGFVAVLPEHPGNNRANDELAGTEAILADRPRHVRQVIDWAYADSQIGPRLCPDAVAIIGHSLGGYTALAVAGGRPWAAPHETPDRVPRNVPATPDPRVRAGVLLAPATPWFLAPGALENVHVPLLIVSGEKDEMTPMWHAEVVTRGIPEATPVEHRVIANAGHFSFLSPFPPERTQPGFPPSQDPPGFDRIAFHVELYPLIREFLRQAL